MIKKAPSKQPQSPVANIDKICEQFFHSELPPCLSHKSQLNILGKILPDLAEHRDNFESLPYKEIGLLKIQAGEATNHLREEIFLPFFSDGKSKKRKEKKKEQQTRGRKTHNIIEKNYISPDDMVHSYFQGYTFKTYDPSIVYKTLFLLCYYYALKQHIFNREKLPILDYSTTSSPSEQSIDILDIKDNFFCRSTEDITKSHEEYIIYKEYIQEFLQIGKNAGEDILLSKLLEKSSWSFRIKSISSAVKKMFKDPIYIDNLIYHGSFSDMNGMKIGFYELEQAKAPLDELMNIIRGSSQHTVIKETDRGLKGSYQKNDGTENQDTSHHLSPEYSINIGDKMGRPLLEMQFGLQEKIIYDMTLEKLIAYDTLDFHVNKRNKTIKISYKSAESFRGYMLKYVNHIQHTPYKIKNNRRFAYHLIPNRYFEKTYKTYSGSQAFLYQQFETARHTITEKLYTDLHAPHMQEFFLKNSLRNMKHYYDQGYTIVFIDFRKTPKLPFHNALFSSLRQELQDQRERKGHREKPLPKEEILLRDLMSKTVQTSRETGHTTGEILQKNADPKQRNIKTATSM